MINVRTIEEGGTDLLVRRARRLQALIDLGGTLENGGSSLHVRGLRMNVKWIAEMNETVWRSTLQRVAHPYPMPNDR